MILITPDDEGCYERDFKNSGWWNHGDDYKFKWSYKFNNAFASTTFSMKNYKWKAKKNKWVKDHGSFGKVSIGTQHYKDYESGCEKLTMTSASTFNLKTFFRGDFQSYLLNWSSKNRCNPDESYIICRHRGVDFKFNVKTGELIN